MKTKGFTIVELLIYMGLLLIFLAVLTGIFLSVLDVQLSYQTTSAVSQDSRFILRRLMYDALRAQRITLPGTLGETGSTLAFIIDGASATYAVSNGVLNVTNVNGTDRLNGYGTTVTGFTVTRLGNAEGKQSARILFSVTGVTQQAKGPETRSFEITVGVR